MRFRSKLSARTGRPSTSTWDRIRRGLWPEDVDRLHELWLRLSDAEGVGAKLHHRDIVGVALRRLERDLTVGDRDQVLTDLKDELRKS